jgi:hypothetical protein
VAEQTPSAGSNADDLHDALLAAISTRTATYKELNKIARDFGRQDLDPAMVETALEWVRDPSNDPSLINFYETSAEETAPEEALPPLQQSLVGAEISAYEPTIRDKAWNAAYGVAESLGADRSSAQTFATFMAGRSGIDGEVGLLELTPLGIVPALTEGTATAKRGLATGDYGTAALGGLEAALGAAGAVPIVGAGARAVAKPLLRTGPGMAVAARAPSAITKPTITAQQQAAQDILTRPVNIADVPITPRAPKPASLVPETAPVQAAPAVKNVPTGPGPVPSPATATSSTRLPTPDWANLTPDQRKTTMGNLLENAGVAQPIMSQEFVEKMAPFSYDFLRAAGITERPADVPWTEMLKLHFDSGSVPDQVVQQLIKKHNITEMDINQAIYGMRMSMSDWGRMGQTVGRYARLIPQDINAANKAALKTSADPSLWQRMGNAQRGLMVSQLATTQRNNLSTLARVPLDVVVNLMDDGINAALNPLRRVLGKETVPVKPGDAFALITQRFDPARNKEFYRQLRETQPKVHNKLLGSYSPDVSNVVKDDAFGVVERGVNALNIFNRVSETATRKMAFTSFLRREVNKRGVKINGQMRDFNYLVDNNQTHLIPKKMTERAIQKTLDLTYANKAPWGWANDMIKGLEKMGPIGNIIAPFPRFMANAMKFQLDYSPMGFAKLVSPKQWKQIAAGDTSAISKASIGSAMLYGAYMFQNSEYAGSKWYTAKLPSGKEVDLRPYFPATPYLLVADVARRALNGENVDLAYRAKDLVQGLTGSQFRAGTGLYVVDELFRDLMGSADWKDKAAKIPVKILAEMGASVLTPLNSFKDIYAQLDQAFGGGEEAVYRDMSESPAATLLRAVPGAQRALGTPEQEYASRAGEIATQDPLLRQLLGATIRPEATPFEREMKKLGYEDSELMPSTGYPEVDREQRRLMGEFIDQVSPQLLNNPAYQSANMTTRTAMFKDFLRDARAEVKAEIERTDPLKAQLKWYTGRSREEKIMINEQVEAKTGKKFVQFNRQLQKAPLVQTEEEYAALPSGTKFTDPGDFEVYTKP